MRQKPHHFSPKALALALIASLASVGISSSPNPAIASAPINCTTYASGGTATAIVIDGATFCRHVFSTVGPATFTVFDSRITVVDYLIVAGGGGGAGRDVGGGGGAGGVVSNLKTGGTTTPGLAITTNTAIDVVVGAGGAGSGDIGSGIGQASDGSISRLGDPTANGGGGNYASPGVNGGIGGDFSSFVGTDIGDDGWFAGGGTGASHRDGGGTASPIAAKGGGGLESGGTNIGTRSGKPNTGGGEGASRGLGLTGGTGGSGIVVIRYSLPPASSGICDGSSSQNGFPVTAGHGSMFCIDSAADQQIDASYLAYSVGSSSARSGLWFESFTMEKVSTITRSNTTLPVGRTGLEPVTDGL